MHEIAPRAAMPRGAQSFCQPQTERAVLFYPPQKVGTAARFHAFSVSLTVRTVMSSGGS